MYEDFLDRSSEMMHQFLDRKWLILRFGRYTSITSRDSLEYYATKMKILRNTLFRDRIHSYFVYVIQ